MDKEIYICDKITENRVTVFTKHVCECGCNKYINVKGIILCKECEKEVN